MVNAPIVKEVKSDVLYGGTFIATDNEAKGEIMINSLVVGSIEDFGLKPSK